MVTFASFLSKYSIWVGLSNKLNINKFIPMKFQHSIQGYMIDYTIKCILDLRLLDQSVWLNSTFFLVTMQKLGGQAPCPSCTSLPLCCPPCVFESFLLCRKTENWCKCNKFFWMVTFASFLSKYSIWVGLSNKLNINKFIPMKFQHSIQGYMIDYTIKCILDLRLLDQSVWLNSIFFLVTMQKLGGQAPCPSHTSLPLCCPPCMFESFLLCRKAENWCKYNKFCWMATFASFLPK